MSSRARATVIGLLGPGISLFGLVWVVLDAVFDPTPETANFRYFIFDSAHLIIAVGTIVAAACVPIAIQVAQAGPEELTVPDFEAELAGDETPGEEEAAGERGGSYQWSPK